MTRDDLPPPRIAKLPRDGRGYPVPWFVYFDKYGVPDFRVIGDGKIELALKFNLCWVCGEERGRNYSFVIGPMCTVNRVAPEPPSHRVCAIYSAVTCPFLTRPKQKRNPADLPSHKPNMPGYVDRNPGVTAVWCTREFTPFRNGPGALFQLGEPSEVLWYAHGRAATRAEVLASIDSGLPKLREDCELEATPARREAARVELERRTAAALMLAPKEADIGPQEKP